MNLTEFMYETSTHRLRHCFLWCALAPAIMLAASHSLFAADPPSDSTDSASTASQTAQPTIGLRTDVTADASVPVVDTTPPQGNTGVGPVNLIGPVTPTFAASELATPPDLYAPPAPAPATAPTAPGSPSQNVTINLINRLVQRGVLSKEDADDLIKQAEKDAATARAQAASAQLASAGARPADDSVHVTYVPEVVKAQMREDIKQQVLQQARAENWAAPRSYPDWVSRFHFFGDVRTRYEGDFYPSNNNPSSLQFVNFNSINTGGPLNTLALPGNLPYTDVDENRDRLRLRARFGVDVDLGTGFTTGMRLATGETNSPVTENQSLGYSNNGQGGDFSKYALWLDRAFIKYDVGGTPEKDLNFTVGRFDNPFFATSMIWADDLGFDGIAAKGKYQVADGITPFVTAGAFPVYNTDLNFATYSPTKTKSDDKWLYAIQAGSDFKINEDFNLKVAAAFYYFQDIEGKVSDPYTQNTSNDAGDTDDSRPAFAQKGNTYIALRNIDSTSTTFYQYYGLATPFHEVALTTRLDFNHFDPFHMWLIGEAVKNVAFDKNAILNNGSPNTPGPQNNLGNDGFDGGDTAAILTLNVGRPVLEKLWDWNFNIGYRYVESDSVVDGFCDSDFAMGGTNVKGYTIGGNVAFSPRVWAGVRWMSSDSIAGPTFNLDIIQLDLNAKF